MRFPFFLLPLVVCAALLPGTGRAMTADGAMITNFAAATAYWGTAGPAFTSRYTVSYNATVGVIVSCPVIWITKMVSPTMLAIGQTATYTICVVNTSLQASAWGIIINDQLPNNVGYVNPSWAVANWMPVGTTLTLKSSATGVPPYAGGEPGNGQTAPYYLQWTFDKLGPNRSACVTFKATVL